MSHPPPGLIFSIKTDGIFRTECQLVRICRFSYTACIRKYTTEEFFLRLFPEFLHMTAAHDGPLRRVCRSLSTGWLNMHAGSDRGARAAIVR